MRDGRVSRACLTGLAVALALPLGGCPLWVQFFTTPDSARLAGYANDFHFWNSKYEAACAPPDPLPRTAPLAECQAMFAALGKTRKSLTDAGEALKRGGKLTHQMADVKANVKKLEAMRKWTTS